MSLTHFSQEKEESGTRTKIQPVLLVFATNMNLLYEVHENIFAKFTGP
jgi:hypothetical protein